MKIKQIIDIIEGTAPLATAEEWDNTGLAIGSIERDCTGVICALDLTLDIVRQAAECGCNLILMHHPFFFHAAQSIDVDTARGEIVELVIKHDITVYSAHTNLDKADGGVCQTLAAMLGAKNIVSDGLGVYFEIEPIGFTDFARRVAERLNDRSVKMTGNSDAVISRVYLVSGGGGDMELYARARELADVFVSGDMKHHIYIEAENDGFLLVEYSHYASEIIVQQIFDKLLAQKCAGLNIIKAEQKCPFKLLEEI